MGDSQVLPRPDPVTSELGRGDPTVWTDLDLEVVGGAHDRKGYSGTEPTKHGTACLPSRRIRSHPAAVGVSRCATTDWMICADPGVPDR
jgi:hypothetical protein